MQIHNQHESAMQTANIISRLFSLFSILLFLLVFFESVGSLFPLVYGPLAIAMLAYTFILVSIPQNYRKPLVKPAFAVMMLSPFPTWYMHYQVNTPYIIVCLLLFIICTCYLLYISIKQCQQIARDMELPRMVTLMNWALRALIYFGFMPCCLSLMAGFQTYSMSGQSFTHLLYNQDAVVPFSIAYVYAFSIFLCWVATLILRWNLKKQKQLLNEQTCLQF